MPRSTTFLARGPSSRDAMRALFQELDAALPERDDPGLVITIQARAEHDGSGYVAEAAVWHVRKYRDPDE